MDSRYLNMFFPLYRFFLFLGVVGVVAGEKPPGWAKQAVRTEASELLRAGPLDNVRSIQKKYNITFFLSLRWQ